MPRRSAHLVDWSHPLLTTCGAEGEAGTTDLVEVGCHECLAVALTRRGFTSSDDGEVWSFPGDQRRRSMTITALHGGVYRLRVHHDRRPWVGDFHSLSEAAHESEGM